MERHNIGRRLIIATTLAMLLARSVSPCSCSAAAIPEEPIRIGHESQFLFDLHVVDNYWAIHYKRQAVQRVFHQPTKHPANPVMKADSPSYTWVVRDEKAGVFRMYYQANVIIDGSGAKDSNQEVLPDAKGKTKGRKFRTFIAYAESPDGIKWTRPHLDHYPGRKPKPNNIVIAHSEHPMIETCSPALLELPEKDRRGYKYTMLYRGKGRGAGTHGGIRAISSKDGIRWDESSDTIVAHLHSDHPNTISYDPLRDEYVMYCRAKDIYRAWGDTMIDTGASRRVARMSSKTLFGDWMEHTRPQTIIIPDEVDNQIHHNFYYGMPTVHRAGLYWGFLENFRMNDFIYTELAFSRDGFQFQRLPLRPKLLEYGEDGEWDDTMIFMSPAWVEVGDEWWFYYSGWDGPHGTPERNGAIGLATVRKEGLISLRGPKGGGVVATRRIIWPGGDLAVNANASGGTLTVRVSDSKRKPIEGFNHADCKVFSGDNTSHVIAWNGRSLNDLNGKEIRLEFHLKDADLYTFRATR